MTVDTVREIVTWLKNIPNERITFTFHGGEPLLAGAEFYRQTLPLLSEGLARMHPEFAMQTNLWRMTPEIADILAKHHVPIGSSIDGPETITDSQRGDGYYQKTMKGYEIAKAYGLDVRFICTFTNRSVKKREEIFRFFLEKGFTLKLHPALPSLRSENPKEWSLEPADYGELLVYLLDEALDHMGEIDVMNVNDLCRCVFTRRGSVCTYVDCMGSTFAVGPDGSIYPCYRFVGMEEYVMGNVTDRPSIEELMLSPPGKLMLSFKGYVDSACGKCKHIKYCRGGCPYNAMAPTSGRIEGVDPHCIAYTRIFDEIGDRLNKEMFDAPPLEIGRFGSAQSQKPGKPGVMTLMRKNAMR
jgi:uncharacterized protein